MLSDPSQSAKNSPPDYYTMIQLSFDLQASNYLELTQDLIDHSKINRKDLLGINIIINHDLPYDELQLTVANYQSAIQLVSTYDGIQSTLVTPEDIEVHLVK